MENLYKKRKIIIISAIFTMICVLVLVITYFIVTNKGCIIDIKEDFTRMHPLLLKDTADEFILPFSGRKISFSFGQELRLSCPGRKNYVNGTKLQQEVTLTCVSDQIFLINNNKSDRKNFQELKCLNYPEPTARSTGQKCSTSFTEIEIGFETNTGFVRVITTCFDETKKESVYSTYNLTSNINNQQSAARPKNFKKDFYKNLNPENLYKRKSQLNRFEKILSSRELAEKYVSFNKTEFYLSRGHLTAKSDFIYGSQQRATFFYINVAPQWQTFNGKNWNALEVNCRNFASKHDLDLIVYTGVYGNAKLPDLAGNLHDLSLGADVNNNNILTVPEVFWKILYNPVSKRGTVFIGHNNPYSRNVKKLCSDVCDKINWLSWKAENITLGYSYCCEYSEFKKINDYLPDIQVDSLLV